MINSKKIAIFGFGKEGISAANYLEGGHISIIEDKEETSFEKSEIKKFKQKGIHFFFGKIYPKNDNFDLLIRSPGFHPKHPKITHFLKQGAKLTTPTNIFFEHCVGKIIGVTGTKGKGTTASLIYEILKTAQKDVYLAGNIGTPMLDILPKINKNSIIILELSSFQLTDLNASPHIAIVLMITSEHLDWHSSQEEYQKSKESIVKYQKKGDFAVINQDFEISKKMQNLTPATTIFFSTAQKVDGIYVDNKAINSNLNGQEIIAKISNIRLPGKHNLQNVCATIATTKILEIESEIIRKSLLSFKGLKHRLQFVKEISGTKFINDSYSTIPETTIAAVESFGEPKILILGGSSKKSDFTTLAQKISQDKSIKALILIGKEATRIKEALNKQGNLQINIAEGLIGMKDIVQKAQILSSPGDIVILSPACASFDMFKNYQDRGEQFINIVQNLSNS